MGLILQNESYCIVKEKLRGIIEFGQIAIIDLWYHKSLLDYTANCYFWCDSKNKMENIIDKNNAIVSI